MSIESLSEMNICENVLASGHFDLSKPGVSNTAEDTETIGDTGTEKTCFADGGSEAVCEMPVMPDYDAMAAMTDEERKAAERKYEQELAEYISLQAQSKAAPIIEQYEIEADRAKSAAIKSELSAKPEFEGFSDNIERIEGIIEKIKMLKSLPPDERYTLAYLIDRGQNTKGKSGAELVDALFSDKEAMRILEMRRLAEYDSRYNTLPQFASSQGAASMPANVASKPKTIDQAGRAAKKYFGL